MHSLPAGSAITGLSFCKPASFKERFPIQRGELPTLPAAMQSTSLSVLVRVLVGGSSSSSRRRRSSSSRHASSSNSSSNSSSSSSRSSRSSRSSSSSTRSSSL